LAIFLACVKEGAPWSFINFENSREASIALGKALGFFFGLGLGAALTSLAFLASLNSFNFAT